MQKENLFGLIPVMSRRKRRRSGTKFGLGAQRGSLVKISEAPVCVE